MKSFIVAAVVIGAFCIFQVSAIKMCYSCTDCAKVDSNTATCNTTMSCLKVTNGTTARSCSDEACKTKGCKTVDSVETCCCDTDKCNGAGALTSALVMVIAPVVASIYFTRS